MLTAKVYYAPSPRGALSDADIRPSVCLSHGAAACLGYRHAGCLQLSHRRPPDMCGLQIRRDFLDPWFAAKRYATVQLPSAGGYRLAAAGAIPCFHTSAAAVRRVDIKRHAQKQRLYAWVAITVGLQPILFRVEQRGNRQLARARETAEIWVAFSRGGILPNYRQGNKCRTFARPPSPEIAIANICLRVLS